MTAERVRLETNDAWPVALVECDGRWLTLNSRRDPIAEAAQALSAVADHAPLVVIVGLGLGYALDALERREWRGRVLAIEVEPALGAVMRGRRDWAAWENRLTVIDADAIDGELWRRFAHVPIEPPVIVHPVLARTHGAAVERVRAQLARAWFDHSANDAARRANAGRYLLNTLRNLPVLRTEGDVVALDGLFTGVPSIVVAAGPSLDEDLAGIKEYRDRALIIAVDTATRPLLGAGVVPDLIVAVDPTEANARHLCDLESDRETWLVAEASVDPVAVDQFQGRTFFYRVADHHPWPWLRRSGLDRGTLRAWGSVLTTAFDLTVRMGCDPIVFAGADLAFTHQRPYARGITFEEDWRRDEAWGHTLETTWSAALSKWPLVTEPGVDGTAATTAPHLRAFRDWIHSQAGATRARVVNASAHGILHGDHIARVPLHELGRQWTVLPPEVRSRLRRSYRPPSLHTAAPPEPLAEWIAFAPDVTETACLDALGSQARPATREGALSTQEALVLADPGTRGIVESLCPGDQRVLSDWFRNVAPEAWQLVVAENGGVDVEARVRRAAEQLPPHGVLLVVDRHGFSCSAQLRGGIEPFLCEHPTASVEYRRFLDRESRLAIVRLNGASGGSQGEADAGKRGEADRVAAERLIPMLVSHFRPNSLLDLGCGVGQWADAARRAGVARVEGVTSRDVPTIDTGTERFDVCLCIEVAQWLAPEGQEAFLAAATRASDIIVFSSPPPGQPSEPPQARPLVYWTEKFWQHGYVLDDSLRQLVEQTFGAVQSKADVLVTFRRLLTPSEAAAKEGPVATLRGALLAQAIRIQDLWMQVLWQQRWTPPRSHMRRLRLERHRLQERDAAGARHFKFRTDAARSWLAHGGADLRVFEDEAALPAYTVHEAFKDDGLGGYAVWRDEIVLVSTDGRDPRFNGRTYSVLVPEFVAYAEERRLSEILAQPL